MKLSDLSKLLFFLIIFINFSKLFAENEVDIWKKNPSKDLREEVEKQNKKIPSPLINKNNISTRNIIQEENSTEINNTLLYGIPTNTILSYQCGPILTGKIFKKQLNV